ncbi:DKNYY domain-containing protein [Gallaecimonas xiamenensis]|uniref:Membrane protein n=1 Tax=Gallaecimonas xiamenensis 3-C-1 TaxID=745411 RepID=K2IXD7_9GAMM|nr:DKNYY domain-containing protein [Gallaecimonas xiamenensis]EKE67538.1 membrane protein [Gallaecimonas xiamenensis 3-C-1]
MKIFLNVVITLALLYWPLLLMFSPMAFDAPGSENSRRAVFGVVAFLSYPVLIFLLLGLFGGQYFGFNGFPMALVAAVVVSCVLTLFGFTGMVKNALMGIPNSGYALVRDQAYYNAKPIKGADLATFKPVKREDFGHAYEAQLYALDNAHLYYSGEPVADVSVQQLQGRIVGTTLYWFTDHQVITDGKVIEGANPASFDCFEEHSSWCFSKTDGKGTVFYHKTPIPQADFASFTPLTETLAKDKNAIYWLDTQLQTDADPATFELLADDSFARDKQHVYFRSAEQMVRLDKAEPDSFELLDRQYCKGSGVIYYAGNYEIRELEGADFDTFEVTDYDEKTQSDARDAKHFYMRGELVTQ